MSETSTQRLIEADQVIEGQAKADQLLRGLRRSLPRGDELYKALVSISQSSNLAVLQGFARSIQKELERCS